MSDLPASTLAESRLVLSDGHEAEIIAHCVRAYPLEGCGLLAGDLATGRVEQCFLTLNAAQSARLYVVDPLELLRADRQAEAAGMTILGVFHSHTHTDAYPSPTDVNQAPDPDWHYVLISLRHEVSTIRSYRIVDAAIHEEPIERPS